MTAPAEWVVISTTSEWGLEYLNMRQLFTDYVEAMREAKRLSQNPAVFVTVIEPNGEEWGL